jgi:hypothetical protein
MDEKRKGWKGLPLERKSSGSERKSKMNFEYRAFLKEHGLVAPQTELGDLRCDRLFLTVDSI